MQLLYHSATPPRTPPRHLPFHPTATPLHSTNQRAMPSRSTSKPTVNLATILFSLFASLPLRRSLGSSPTSPPLPAAAQALRSLLPTSTPHGHLLFCMHQLLRRPAGGIRLLSSMAAVAVLALLLLLAQSAEGGGGGGCGGGEAGFTAGRSYAACGDLPRLGASVRWTYDRAAGELSVAFVAAPAAPGGWVAWGLNPFGDGMAGAQALLAGPSSSGGGAWAVRTYNITGYALGEPGPIAFPASDLAAELGADGRVRLSGTLSVGSDAGVLNQVWQVGSAVSGGVPAPHAMGGDNLAAKGKLDLLRDTTAAASSTGGDSLANNRNIHGVLNTVSWGIALPMGAIFARYLKTFKSADPAWFYLHVTCQMIGYAVGVAGWATGINLGNESNGVTYTLHRNIGIAVFALGTLQVFALFLRPKKEHKYRVYWNMYHHSVGYAVIILGITNIFKGMIILGVEQRWKTAYVAALCVLGFAAVILEALTWSIVVKQRQAESKTFNSASNGRMQPAYAL